MQAAKTRAGMQLLEPIPKIIEKERKKKVLQRFYPVTLDQSQSTDFAAQTELRRKRRSGEEQTVKHANNSESLSARPPAASPPARQPACLPASLPACLPAYSRVCISCT